VAVGIATNEEQRGAVSDARDRPYEYRRRRVEHARGGLAFPHPSPALRPLSRMSVQSLREPCAATRRRGARPSIAGSWPCQMVSLRRE
jgi:hypothetical protein